MSWSNTDNAYGGSNPFVLDCTDPAPLFSYGPYPRLHMLLDGSIFETNSVLSLFDREGSSGGMEFSGLQALVWILVIAGIVVLGAVAFIALRRRGSPANIPAASSTAPLRSSRDEDPLSRSASGWEVHAAELMKAGRYREAIRAWYHALLVTCFRAGLLHYRKDRTNWEYAFSLSPDHAWRPRFMEATRSFEREWYGRRATDVDTASGFQGDANALLEIVRGGGVR